MIPNYNQSAQFYNVFNKDKPYTEEAHYVSTTLMHECPWIQDILEFGCGTGKHSKALCELGFNVHGIEHAPEMVKVAREHPIEGFRCDVGDIRTVQLGRKFDAVVALWAVMSYMTSDDDFTAALNTAYWHLDTGGLFMFDVWNGPGILDHRPKSYKRTIEDYHGQKIVRHAVYALDERDRTITISYKYQMDGLSFSEQHRMRYFFPDDITKAINKKNKFKCLSVTEMPTGREFYKDNRYATYLLQKL